MKSTFRGYTSGIQEAVSDKGANANRSTGESSIWLQEALNAHALEPTAVIVCTADTGQSTECPYRPAQGVAQW